jgi:hypothetical protein
MELVGQVNPIKNTLFTLLKIHNSPHLPDNPDLDKLLGKTEENQADCIIKSMDSKIHFLTDFPDLRREVGEQNLHV